MEASGGFPISDVLRVLPPAPPLIPGQRGHHTSCQPAAEGRRVLCGGATVPHITSQYISITDSCHHSDRYEKQP